MAWVDGDAKEGNPADMPSAPNLEEVSAWRIGKPDLIVHYPDYKMKAAGPDLYGTLTAPFGTTEDRYIKAIQSRVELTSASCAALGSPLVMMAIVMGIFYVMLILPQQRQRREGQGVDHD